MSNGLKWRLEPHFNKCEVHLLASSGQGQPVLSAVRRGEQPQDGGKKEKAEAQELHRLNPLVFR